MSLDYNILATGSGGNALLINNFMLIDCGIPFTKIKCYINTIQVILLTHLHSDHFNKSCIKKIAYEKPNIKFVCGEWLAEELLKLNVMKKNICVVKHLKTYDFGTFTLEPINTYHDVENVSYVVKIKSGATFYYVTDTYRIDNYSVLHNLDYYFVENNYDEEEIKKRIEEKELNNQYVYERRVINSHMSKQETDKFLKEVMGENSQYVYVHQHQDKENCKNEYRVID